MKCFVLFAMSVVCVGQVAGADFVPMRGSASSVYTTDNSKTEFIQCDYGGGGVVLTIDGEHRGKFSHLGKTTGESTVIYNSCTGTYDMEIDFTSANGDTVHLTGNGYDVLPYGPDGGINSFSHFEIDEGTGRFEGASGNITLAGYRFDDVVAGTSIDTFDLDGMISTVGSVQSASAVPEPTSLALLGLGGGVLSCLTRRRRR